MLVDGENSARSLEQSFCQDFSCCGNKLKSLHDLLEHYESVHVHVDDDGHNEADDDSQQLAEAINNEDPTDDKQPSTPTLQSVKTLLAGRVFGGPKLPSPTERNIRQIPNAFKRSKLLHNHPFGAHQLQQQQQLFSSQDIYYYHYHTDSEHDASSINASQNSGWTINNRPSSMADSAFDDAVIRKKPTVQHLVEIPSGFEPNTDGFTTDEEGSTAVAGMSTALSQASVLLPSHHSHPASAGYHSIYHNDYTSTTVAPSMLSSSEDDDTAEPVHFDVDAIQNAAAKAIRLQKRYSSVNKPAATSPSPHHQSNLKNEYREDRRYKCLVPGCDKVYRNQNGLKYHIEHGHTKNERQYAEAVMRAIKEDPTEKPYACAIPACHKRYRNANGLKYHLIHHHNPNEVALYTSQQ